ncbi:hypothetical protein ACJ73_09749 [Blastomyces percursus]|uniref:C2H2-type domain-containing protein n=1 Tax=Blastomyces percursus TaxID=1658174 RepID=A0A1J9Q620_9EURO|nr:hypothetical protein ACJ73_09749 [Blastomyces percursus]
MGKQVSSGSDTFTLPEIISDPSLILSPHVFLLGMLFHFQAFKSPSLTSPERLYDLGVLEGLNQQKPPLRDDLRDKFLFCEAVREGETVKLLQGVSYRMRKGGELTGLEETANPYGLRNGNANALNKNPDVSDSLQNQILKHSNTTTFVKHYQDRNITVNTYRNYRGLDPKADEYLNLNTMSLSIDPRRPWKLTAKESRSVNEQPKIRKLAMKVERLRRKRDATAPGKKRDALEDWYKDAQKRLNNGKQQARVELKRQKQKRYNEEQPVIDSERQLAGLIVDEAVKGVLERTEYMNPEMMILIDSLLTLPGDSWDTEQHRRLKAINAITSFCRGPGGLPAPVSWPRHHERNDSRLRVPTIEEAIRSVLIKNSEEQKNKRPTMCFLCLQNEKLKLHERVHSYHGASITKHFERKHLKDFKKLDCNICKVTLGTLKNLLIHAETVRGTVTRNPKYLQQM